MTPSSRRRRSSMKPGSTPSTSARRSSPRPRASPISSSSGRRRRSHSRRLARGTP
jgi:hypothetical protein